MWLLLLIALVACTYVPPSPSLPTADLTTTTPTLPVLTQTLPASPTSAGFPPPPPPAMSGVIETPTRTPAATCPPPQWSVQGVRTDFLKQTIAVEIYTPSDTAPRVTLDAREADEKEVAPNRPPPRVTYHFRNVEFGGQQLVATDGCNSWNWIVLPPPTITTSSGVPPPALAPVLNLPTPLPPPAPFTQARVISVVDGDTIDVLIDGKEYRVRYIGVDTPETVHPARGVEPFGVEASNRNRELVTGKIVYLEKDVSETDQFGRLLRYVWLVEDGRMVNDLLVREGYAQVSTYPPDVRHQERLLEAQREAREAGRGLWGSATPSVGLTPAPTGAQGACDPSYPTVCIPSPPPDLDCREVTYRRFKVLPPDPHGFDGDHDGVGCE